MTDMDNISNIIREQNVFSHLNEGILVANVSGTTEGFTLAKEVLLRTSNNKTAMYLSGGRTPKDFYHILSTEEKFDVGTLGLVDERFGPRFHENSNEKMIMDSGLLQAMDKKGVKFHPILQGAYSHPHENEDLDSRFPSRGGLWRGNDNEDSMQKTAEEYDETLRTLNATYQQSIAILGIGVDGHTVGLPARMSNVQYPISNEEKDYKYVIAYDYPVGVYGKRITMTFLGLSMLDLLVVMVFGEDKKEALGKMFEAGSEEEIPSRFYKRPDIAARTLLITDQKV